MPSPFPGMDPYLEDPGIWPDFHHRFATILSEELNDQLPAPFYARMEMRPELGIVEEPEETARSIVPDVLILRQPHQTQGPGSGGILVMDAPGDKSRQPWSLPPCPTNLFGTISSRFAIASGATNWSP